VTTPTGKLRPDGAPPRTLLDERAARQAQTALAVSVLDARTLVEVTVPRTSVRARMRLLTRSEGQQVRQESRLALAAVGLTDASRSPAPESWREWHEELVPRTLAVAVRALDADLPLAPLDEWQICDDAQIRALWQRYQDLETQLDPLASLELSTELLEEIIDAAKKKDAALLTSFGSSALASCLITTASQPAT
jgi:hypothetical protein